MPTTATTTGQANKSKSGDTAKPVSAAPFVRSSAQHRESAGIDVTKTLGSSVQTLPVFNIPAVGYVRAIVLYVTATGGSGTSVAANADGPFNVLQGIQFTEPNGSVIQSFESGYHLYLANKYGGYRFPSGSDPKSSPAYSAVAGDSGDFSFLVRIPVELNLRDALGSLPNQSAAATFKLQMRLADSDTVYSTAPATTLPDVRVRGYLETWDQPDNGQTPPALNTTQYWSSQVLNYGKGEQTLQLSRVGNYIRNLIFIAERSSGTRANGQDDWPDPVTLYLDTRPLDTISAAEFANQMFERTGYGAAHGSTVPDRDDPGGLDNGVFAYDFTHDFDGGLGRENRNLWLPTLPSTRLEIRGSFANAGTLTVLTNDVNVAGSVFL